MSRAHSYSHSRAHFPTFSLLHLRHNSFSDPSVTLPTSQLILQPFRCFTYITAHSPTHSVASPTSQLILQPIPLLHLRHSSFSNPSVALPTSQLILQPIPLLHLRHNSFSKPSVTLPTSQLILQPFRCFTYVTVHSPALLSLLLRHRIFTYVTWRAAHDGVYGESG